MSSTPSGLNPLRRHGRGQQTGAEKRLAARIKASRSIELWITKKHGSTNAEQVLFYRLPPPGRACAGLHVPMASRLGPGPLLRFGTRCPRAVVELVPRCYIAPLGWLSASCRQRSVASCCCCASLVPPLPPCSVSS